MTALPEYFIGAGDVHVAKLDPTTGLPLSFRNIGEAKVVEWDASEEFVDNFKTSKAAPNFQDLHLAIKRTGMLTVQAAEKTIKNLELWLGGTSTAPIAGSYTGNDAFRSGIVAGESDLMPKRHVGLSSVVIKDSAGTPATLALTTNYTYDADSGMVTWVNLGSFVQPFKAFSYSYSASSIIQLLSSTPPDLAVMFDGINLLVSGERIRAIFDRIAFAVATKIALKAGTASGTANAADEFEMKGPALLGLGKTSTDGYGEYREY